MPTERLYIFCEGQTEENFCNNVLEPHFRTLEVGDVRPLLLPNKFKSTLRKRKGGWVSYAVARAHILRVLAEQHRPNTWFTTMLDLYAIPRDFPNLAGAPQSPPLERVRALEESFAADIQSQGYRRFTAHLQLHEYESLLLADCDAVEKAFPGRAGSAAALRRDIEGLAPEEVNEGRETAPSKRIIRHVPEYEGLKTSAGPIIAAEIGLTALRQHCPHFGQWIDALEFAVT